MKLIFLVPLLTLIGCQAKDLSTRNNCSIGNCKDGQGTYLWEDGKKYKGAWANYRKHGEGTLFLSDGTEISGMWENDVLKTNATPTNSATTTVLTTQQTTKEKPLDPIIEMHRNENRTALLIGNSKYRGTWFGDLKNPANDVKVMKEALEKLQFQVIIKMDGDRHEILDTLYEFGSTLKKRGGVGLFLYSGHGLQVDGENYIVPSNDGINFIEEVKHKTIDLKDVLNIFESSGTRINVAIFDACRESGKGVIPSRNQTRSIMTRGWSNKEIKTNQTLIAYSTAPNTVAQDGKGNNSPYVLALTEALQKKNLTIESVLKEVKKKVESETNNEQQPWIAASISEELILNP